MPTALLLSMSLPFQGALPKLFSTVSSPSTMSTLPSRSIPTELSQAFPTVSRPSTMSTLPSRSLPTELSPSYFPRLPFTMSRFRLALSQQSSPQAIIPHGFPSVHNVHASVSHPNGALPKLFPTVSHPSTMSTLPSTELSQSDFPRFPVRPRCLLAPSQRSSPHELFLTVSFPSMMPTLPSCTHLGKVN